MDALHSATLTGLAARLRRLALGALMLAAAASAHQGHEHHGDAGAPPMAGAVRGPDVLAPGYGPLGFDSPRPGSYRLPPIRAAADGEVLLASGARSRLHEVFGTDRLVFLSFMYTRCPDPDGCPLASFVLQRIHRELGRSPDLAGRVRLVSLSFDPETDSPQVMREYARLFDADSSDDWAFLTSASMQAVQPVLDAYGQGVERIYDEAGRYTGHLAHILRVYLIDPARQVRNIYNVSYLHPDILLADARTLLMEADAQAEGAAGSAVGASPSAGERLARALDPPPGLPALPAALRDGLSAERVALGQRLFLDRRLSANGSLSCASCHVPAQAFAHNAMARSIGVEGAGLRRNAPSVLNVAYRTRLFWDGRESRLDTLVWSTLLDESVLGNRAVDEVMARLRADAAIEQGFAAAFPREGLTMKTLADSLAAYLTVLVSGGSRFDRWHFGGDGGALTDEEQRGYALFTGRAGCAACHTIGPDHALFADDGFHDTGVGYAHSMGKRARRDTIPVGDEGALRVNLAALRGTEERPYNDLGRYEVTQHPADRWRYRTPSLRNVALTAPYMHDGSIATLEGVVAHYDDGGMAHELQAPQIRPLGLSEAERASLVAFLRTLTDPAFADPRSER